MTGGWGRQGVKGDGMKTHCYYYYEEVVQYMGGLASSVQLQKFAPIHFSKPTV